MADSRLAFVEGTTPRRSLFNEQETSATRRDFRANCRKAFDDMVRVGGLESWSVEVTGRRRVKGRRYRYVMASGRQLDLRLLAEPNPELRSVNRTDDR